VDVDVDEQVGASGDDWFVRIQPSTAFSNTAPGPLVGNSDGTNYGYGTGQRFTSVDVPSGATIDVAYISLRAYVDESSTTVRSDVTCENSKNPSAPTAALSFLRG